MKFSTKDSSTAASLRRKLKKEIHDKQQPVDLFFFFLIAYFGMPRGEKKINIVCSSNFYVLFEVLLKLRLA